MTLNPTGPRLRSAWRSLSIVVLINLVGPAAGLANEVLVKKGEFQAHKISGESLIEVHYSPTASGRFLTAASDGLAIVWEKPGVQKQVFRNNPPSMLFSGRLQAGDRRLITGAYNGFATVWWLDSTKTLQVAPHLSGVTDADVLNGNDGIVTTSDDGSIRFWTPDAQLRLRIQRPGVSRNLAVARTRDLVAVTQDISAITLLNGKGQVLQAFLTEQGRLNDVIFSHDESLLLTTGFDGSVKVWRLPDARLKPELLVRIQASQQGWINGIDINKEERLASVGDDGVLRLWNLKGQLLSSLHLSTHHLMSVSYSHDGNTLLVAAQDGMIYEVSVQQL